MCHSKTHISHHLEIPPTFPGLFTTSVAPLWDQLTFKLKFNHFKINLSQNSYTMTMTGINNTSQWEAPKFSFSTTNQAKKWKTYVRALDYLKILDIHTTILITVTTRSAYTAPNLHNVSTLVNVAVWICKLAHLPMTQFWSTDSALCNGLHPIAVC